MRRVVCLPVLVAILVATSAASADAAPIDRSRVDAQLAREAALHPEASFDVIVQAATDRGRGGATAPERARAAVATHGGRARFALGIIGASAASVSGRDLIALSHDPAVRYVYRDAPVAAAFDPFVDYWKVKSLAITTTHAPYAWNNYNACGRGVTIAVVDSGVYAHPDLGTRLLASVDLTQDPPLFSIGALGDPGGHGTHVAGLIAGDGTASGFAYTGTAPCAQIVSVRVLDANGRSTTSTVLRGLQWVLANRTAYGIRVVNLSLGADAAASYHMSLLSAAVEALTLAGVTVVAAAGNGGPIAETIISPAADPFVLAVGALDDLGTTKPSDDVVATFSARGPSKVDNLAKPDLVAPGRRVVSLLSPGSTLATLYPERRVTASGATSPQYLMLSGTSMSAAIVSGLVALLLEREPTLTPFQVKHRMKAGVRQVKAPSADVGSGEAMSFPLGSYGDLVAEYPGARVADALASQLFAQLYGQPLPLKSLSYNGGTDSRGTPWSSVTWDDVIWDSITWDNIAWEAFHWDNIAWESICWDVAPVTAPLGTATPGTLAWSLVD